MLRRVFSALMLLSSSVSPRLSMTSADLADWHPLPVFYVWTSVGSLTVSLVFFMQAHRILSSCRSATCRGLLHCISGLQRFSCEFGWCVNSHESRLQETLISGKHELPNGFTLIKKTYILDGGTLELDKSFLTWKVNIGTKVRIPVWATYVETDEAKLLVDTGFHIEHAQKFYAWENPQQSVGQRIDSQLKAIGVKPEDIDLVVHTHLHFDHCGYDFLFPKATFIVQKEELRHAWVPDPFEKIGYCRPDFDVPDLKWELINDEREIINGVSVVKTPGHAAGHQTVLVESKEMGTLILENDAIFTQENLQKRIVGGIHFNAEDMLDSMLKLERLAKEQNGKIMYSHDAEFYKTMKLAPKYYT